MASAWWPGLTAQRPSMAWTPSVHPLPVAPGVCGLRHHAEAIVPVCSNAGFHSGTHFTAVQCCEAVPGRSPKSGKSIHKSPRELCHSLSPRFSDPATRPNAALWNALPTSLVQWLPWPKPLGPRGRPDKGWLAWSSLMTAPLLDEPCSPPAHRSRSFFPAWLQLPLAVCFC